MHCCTGPPTVSVSLSSSTNRAMSTNNVASSSSQSSTSLGDAANPSGTVPSVHKVISAPTVKPSRSPSSYPTKVVWVRGSPSEQSGPGAQLVPKVSPSGSRHVGPASASGGPPSLSIGAPPSDRGSPLSGTPTPPSRGPSSPASCSEALVQRPSPPQNEPAAQSPSRTQSTRLKERGQATTSADRATGTHTSANPRRVSRRGGMCRGRRADIGSHYTATALQRRASRG